MSMEHESPSQLDNYYMKKNLQSNYAHNKQVDFLYNDQSNHSLGREDKKTKPLLSPQQHEEGKVAVIQFKGNPFKYRLSQEERKKDFIINQKKEAQERLHSRQQERIILQCESMQNIVVQEPLQVNTYLEMAYLSNNTTGKILGDEMIVGRTPGSWGKFNQTSKKFIGHVINPDVIHRDEKAVRMIQERIAKDQQTEGLKQQSLERIQDETRTLLHEHHKKNVQLEAQSGLFSSQRPLVVIQSNAGFKTFEQKQRNFQEANDILQKKSRILNEINAYKTPSNHNTTNNTFADKHIEIKNCIIKERPKIDQLNLNLISRECDKIPHTSPSNPPSQRIVFNQLKIQQSPKQIPQNEELIPQRSTIDQLNEEREFLTSAQSLNKKAVNFIDSPKLDAKNRSLDRSPHKANNQIDSMKLRRIDKLAMPKKKDFYPDDPLDRTEYKGLFATEQNGANTERVFSRPVLGNSSILSNCVLNTSRPSTQNRNISKIIQFNQNTLTFSRPSTSASVPRSTIFKNPENIFTSINSFGIPQFPSHKQIHKMRSQNSQNKELKQNLLSEINTFEKNKIYSQDNRVGFSRVNLLSFEQKDSFISAKSALNHG